MDTGGNSYASASFRAPIFYDSNDTGYYVDPNSTSRQYQINFNYLYYAGDTSYGFIGTSVYADTINSGYAGDPLELCYYRGSFTTSGGSMRSPLFYDLDNTAYYLDPNSSSRLNTIYQAGVYTRSAAGAGYLSGDYGTAETASTSGAIYTIGGSYQPTSTTLGSMYGIGYTLGSSAGMGFVGNWGMYVASNGTARIFLDSDAGVGYATGSFRSPLFYDFDNTGYYVDPNSASNLYNIQVVTLGVGTAATGTSGEIRATNNITAYYSSDIKFKTNVRDIPNAIETVESIGGKLFDWNDEYIEEHGGEDGYFIQKEDFGVIAQDVLKVFPVAVRTRPDGSLAVDYEKLSALAFAAVAALSTRVKSLEARI